MINSVGIRQPRFEIPKYKYYPKQKSEYEQKLDDVLNNRQQINKLKNKDMLPILYNRDTTIENIYERIEILNHLQVVWQVADLKALTCQFSSNFIKRRNDG